MKNTIYPILLGCSMLAFSQPSVVSLAPLSGSGTSATFTSVHRHSVGVDKNYLAYLLVLPTPNIVWFTATGSCLVEYNRISNGMRLIDDAGTGWLGGVVGIPVGPGGSTLGNSYCSVNTAAVTRTLGANDVTLTIPLSFTSNFSGVMGTFLQSLDVNGVWTGMTQFGNWTANSISHSKPGPFINTVTVLPNQLDRATVDVHAGHTSGASALGMVHILAADSIVGGANRCHVIYFADTNEIKLVNDAGTDFVTNTPKLNSTCAIGSFPPELMYASSGTSEVHLHIPMLFNDQTVKQKLKFWINAFDKQGNLTHWQAAQ